MRNKKSFTLIEMLIVVVIIGILAAALIPRLQSVQARARDTKRKADLHQIATALAIYKEDNGGYNEFLQQHKWRDTVSNWDWFAITKFRFPWWAEFVDYDPNAWQDMMYVQQIVLPRYMTSVPFDSDENSPRALDQDFNQDDEAWGMHGYAVVPLSRHPGTSRANSDLNAVIIWARTESDGSSSNRVTNSPATNWDWLCGSNWWLATGYDNCRVGWLDWIIHANPNNWGATPELYEKYLCTTVVFDSWTTNNGAWWCTSDKNSDDLRYIYIQ